MIDIGQIRLTLDPDYPNKIEIELLENGVGVEGGQFDLADFIACVLKFYNNNY